MTGREKGRLDLMKTGQRITLPLSLTLSFLLGQN